MISLISFSANAYVVNSVTGEVTVRTGAKKAKATKGNKLTNDAVLSIPAGSSIKILDELTSTEYTSVSTGVMTVDELINESKNKARDNAAQVNSTVTLAAPRGKIAAANRVYRDKGMVTRSLNLFDEEGSKIEIDPEALAHLIAYTVYFGKETGDTSLCCSSIPDVIESENKEQDEFGFKLHNPMETPVYFNVLKFSGILERETDISPLGQPAGFYILPPGHTMWRTGNDNREVGEKHAVIACHYSFDIDALIEALNSIINDNKKIVIFPDYDLPVFVKVI